MLTDAAADSRFSTEKLPAIVLPTFSFTSRSTPRAGANFMKLAAPVHPLVWEEKVTAWAALVA